MYIYSIGQPIQNLGAPIPNKGAPIQNIGGPIPNLGAPIPNLEPLFQTLAQTSCVRYLETGAKACSRGA